jgi:glycosyltransferase involved in cell wall biosynthesis
VSALSSKPGVTVTGRVADVRPYLKYAGVAVAPLRLARGVQNKVLEALAMNVPVVAAAQALQGLDVNPPPSVSSAGEPGEFADAVLRYLESGSCATEEGGRNFVVEHFDWDANLAKFDDIASSLKAVD